MRPKSITIDLHAHVGIARAAEIAKPHLDMATIPLAHFASAETRALSAKQEADIAPASRGYDKRLADLDAMGIDVQVVCPPPPQCYYTVPLDIAVQATRVLNDGIAEYVAGKPDRLAGLGSVPLMDGKEAAAELERCMTTLGLKGVEVLTNVDGKELSEPAYAPFWAKAEELGALVLLHPNGFTEGRRLSRFYFNNVIGNPLETTIALHYLIFDGVLERHPRAEAVCRAWRRLSRRLSRAHRSCLGRALGLPCRPAEAADRISQAGLCRHGGVHAALSSPSWCACSAPTMC